MFLEMIAAHVLDPATSPGRINSGSPVSGSLSGGGIGSTPSKPPPTKHLTGQRIDGKRITLYRIRPDGKPHYIGLPGVMKSPPSVKDCKWPGDIWQPADSPVGKQILRDGGWI